MDVTVNIPILHLTLSAVDYRFVGLLEMRPTLKEVATVISARTKDEFSNELGAFTEKTRPTGRQVEKLITGAVVDVQMRIGRDIPSRLFPVAKEAIILRTAMSIERGYFPEQAAQTDSAYELLRKDYLELVSALVKSVVDPTVGTHGVQSVPLTTSVSSYNSLFCSTELLP